VSTLCVLIASVRPGRVGLPVGRWVTQTAAAHGGFDRVEVADLAELGLPMMDEPNHPKLGRYTREHTLAWSALIDAADGFVFVTPEYNHGPAASLLNAMSYLYREWRYKPVAFVSYGGASGGMRGVEAVKPIVTRLSMMPLPEAVAIASIRDHVVDGAFVASDPQQKAVAGMLDELARWTRALGSLRSTASSSR
jgi:NAD(P)H-dependent FMN reductase